VWDEDAILLPGENKLGQYHVAIIRRTQSGWVPTVPPLNALVTNYRMVLQPQTRRQYKPASIPSYSITHVSEVELGPYRGVRIALKTGLRLYLTVNWSQGDELSSTIKAMLITPIGKTFTLKPQQSDLSRLIQFISEL